jgi:hypothetical protein
MTATAAIDLQNQAKRALDLPRTAVADWRCTPDAGPAITTRSHYHIQEISRAY